MKRRGKRLLSLLMAMVMTLMLIPTTAWASFGDLLTRDAAYNAEILAALEQVAGSEDAAKQYYEILQQYNLLDEDGNTVDSWSITMDGEDITLDQLRELLAGDYDPDAYVWVDGTPVTLENINLILQIEDYISYLRETYFSDIQWTDEQRENLNSLMNQLSTDGIQLYAGTDAVGESGYSHAAMVTVVQDTNQSTDAQGVFSVTLANAAEGQEVSFQWEAQVGTQELDTSGTLSGTIELTAGADGTASTTFTVPLTTDQQDGLLSTQARQYFIQLTGLKGALFNDGNDNALYTAATVIATGSGATISGRDALFQQDSPNVNQTGTTVDPAPEGGVWADPDTDERHYAEWSADISLTDAIKQSLTWGVLDAVRLESAYHEDHYNNESGWFLKDDELGALRPVSDGSGGYTDYLEDYQGGQHSGDFSPAGSAKNPMVLRYYYGSIQLAGGGSVSIETGFPSVLEAYEWEFEYDYRDESLALDDGLRVVSIYMYNDFYLDNLLEADVDKTVLDLTSSDITMLTADDATQANFQGSAYYLETTDNKMRVDFPDLLKQGIQLSHSGNQWIVSEYYSTDGKDVEDEQDNPYYYNYYKIQQRADQSYVYFVNNTPPEIESIEIPEGTYALGQQVPIIVTFSEPVCTMYNSLQVNGDHYVAAQYDNEGGYSNVLVFAYGVQQGDAILGLENLHVNAANISDDPTFEEADLDYSLDGVEVTNQPETAISGFSVSSAYSDSDPYLSYAQVSLFQDGSVLPIEALSWLTGSLKSDMMTTYTQQELEEMEQENPGSTSKLTSVYISLDGGETQYPLTYDSDTRMLTSPEFTPPQLSAVRELTHVVELYIGGELVMGKCVLWQIEPVALWQEGDVTATLRVTDNETYLDYDYAENGAIFPEDAAFGIDYIIDPSLIPGPTFDEETFTTYQLDPDTASGYAEDALGQKIPVDETANFVWWTSNPGVATINEFGELTATGAAGEVKIYLTALNGNRDIETQNDDGTYVTGKCRTDYPVTYTYQDPEAAGGTTTTDTLVFGVGQTPFLTVGGSELTAAAGQDLTLIWTSNITAKNAANRGDDTSVTPFTVTLYHGDEQTWTWTYESTNANTIARATIPADYLTYDYENGNNSYRVTISAPYYGSAADNEGTIYSITVDISLKSQPAQVELDDLASYYITDGGTVDIGWTIRNFDFYDNGQDLFRFSITDDSGNTVQGTPTAPGSGTNGTFTGSYRMNVPDFEATSDNPNSYRKVYTVTIQAKNGTDSTWSYDSFLLYVYDANALQILVDGAAGGNHTLSNRETFSEMDQEQILALNRDIYLKEIISINYGDYAWNEVADQIIWDVEGDAATLNYQQGALYSNIDDISYVSYRPTAEFGLSGVDDGTITLSATHKLVNFSGRLDIQVETMKDRLYLFQCYPQAVTQLTFEEYTDASKTATREVTIYSDDTGAAAYYAEYGIASDVYCQTKDQNGASPGPTTTCTPAPSTAPAWPAARATGPAPSAIR